MDDKHLQSLLDFRTKCTSLIEKLEQLKRQNSCPDEFLSVEIETVLKAVRETAFGEYFQQTAKTESETKPNE